jgi:membrane-associated protease RseP (regulator of RpoE activity)
VIPLVRIPGVMYIPWYGILSLIILVIIHEFSHGIMARHAKFRIKSFGLLLLGLIPLGAFVEPDEKQMKGGKQLDRLRVFSIASTMNLLAALLLFGFLVGIYAPLINPYLESVYYPAIQGVNITCVSNCSKVAGLEKGMLFRSINGIPVNSIENVSSILANISNGSNFTFVAGNTTFNSTYDNETGIGIQSMNILGPISFEARAIATFGSFLGLTGLLNFAIGMMNFLPMGIFDGGRIFDEFLMTFVRRRGIKKPKRLVSAINRCITLFILLLILLGVLPFFVNNPPACVCS